MPPFQGGSRSAQGGSRSWEIGPSSNRSSPQHSPFSFIDSPSLYPTTDHDLCPTAQISLLSLNPRAPPFDPAGAAASFLPPEPPPPSSPLPSPAFVETSPFQYQQQVVDRQENINESIRNWKTPKTPAAMAPFNLPTGQPAPNAFQFNNNIHGFPPSLAASLQNTSQDSINSNDSFRTQVPFPWNLPSEYENNGAVAIPDPSPFADPPLPFATPDFNNLQAQFQQFGNQNASMNGAPVGRFRQENGHHMPPGQQQPQDYQQNHFGMAMNGMNMNMNGMNGMHGMNGFNGANNAFQPPHYNGQMNQHQQHPMNFNNHGAPVPPNFQHQNMGMRPQLAPLATQFPPNPYNSPQYNQTYSAPPMSMNAQPFYNGGGGANNYHGPNSTPGSAPNMAPNMNFSSLSLGMSPHGIGPNGNQNNGYGNSHSNTQGSGNTGNNGMMQNNLNGNFQPEPPVNNNPAANARTAPYSSLPSVGTINHPLPPKPQFLRQKQNTINKPDLGHHARAAINCTPQPVAKTPQPKKQSLQSEQGAQNQESGNSAKSPVSSDGIQASATVSEPRHNFTPMLRSGRGKSVTTSVDRAQQVKEWVQNTPVRGNSSRDNSLSSGGTVDGTPKMIDFRVEGAQRDMINGNYERVTAVARFTPRPLATNPFNSNTELAPFSPNSRFGAANGMSPLLRELTRNGTTVPTGDEATSLRFLPFEEYCRQAKPVQWGVMRIRNVSASNIFDKWNANPSADSIWCH